MKIAVKTIEFPKVLYAQEIKRIFEEVCKLTNTRLETKKHHNDETHINLYARSSYPHKNLCLTEPIKEKGKYHSIKICDTEAVGMVLTVGYTNKSIIKFVQKFAEIFENEMQKA